MGLKYRDLSIATAANPRIETGGLCGESKSSILDDAGPVAKSAIAPYVIFQSGSLAFRNALAAMKHGNISFPVVIKPDIGCNGTGVKLVPDQETLKKTLPLFPPNIMLMAQALITHPLEAGIFYIRHPDDEKGHISSITYKESPVLVGDGTSTIKELIHKDPRMALIPHIYLPRLGHRENDILAKDEKLSLVFAGNHCKGAIFRDARSDITKALSQRVNDIMTDIPDFHFGRIDVKFSSIDALKRGEDFQIIEINGVGSEAIHIWDRQTSLWEAYRAQFYHYRQTFLIGAAKKKAGWKSSGAFSLLRSWLKQRRLLASYPMND
ncbi:hypothetical protein DM15PD_03040 [Aristophania vespae]|nr:hypothetical protein DM15PD_03040 [Aristophania vespae]